MQSLSASSTTPSASSLHHERCGCPGTLGDPQADADAAATAAAAMVADSLVHNCRQLLRMGAIKLQRRLKVAYILPHQNVTGGMKTLCSQIQLLQQRGHRVVAVHRPLTPPAGLHSGASTGRLITEAAAAPESQQSTSREQPELGTRTAGVQAASPPPPPGTAAAAAKAAAEAAAVAMQGSLAMGGAVPSWSGVRADEEVLLGPDQHLAAAYPTQTLDAIVCGMFQQVPELLAGLPAGPPIIYYEQGHEFLFGDPLRTQQALGYSSMDHTFHRVMGLPFVLACVSEPVRQLLGTEFGRGKAVVVPNGVDVQAFRPASSTPLPSVPGGGIGERLAAENGGDGANGGMAGDTAVGVERGQGGSGMEGGRRLEDAWTAAGLPAPTAVISRLRALPAGAGPPHLLLVGDPGLPLKGFDTAMQVLQRVVSQLTRLHAHHHQRHTQHGRGPTPFKGSEAAAQEQPLPLPLPLMVTWVCQRMPARELLDVVLAEGQGLVLALYVQPKQDLLPCIYRAHQSLLFTSHYEAWGMPVLEAMACGLAVVSTSVSGVLSFTHPGQDCLTAPPGDIQGLSEHVLRVLLDPQLRARLQQRGRETACAHSLTTVADTLEELLYSAVAAAEGLRGLGSHPMCQAAAQRACLAAIQASARLQLVARH